MNNKKGDRDGLDFLRSVLIKSFLKPKKRKPAPVKHLAVSATQLSRSFSRILVVEIDFDDLA
jgi:hypothetical protein